MMTSTIAASSIEYLGATLQMDPKRIKFRAERVKDVILFVHRLSPTERASIEVTNLTDGGCEVRLDIRSTSTEDLKHYMRAVATIGANTMVESLAEEGEFISTSLPAPDESKAFVKAYQLEGSELTPAMTVVQKDTDPGVVDD
jgi:hypothetical protein